MQFTSVNRVISKFYRDLKGTALNESDAIEWIGEALDFLRVYKSTEQAVAFIEVNNYIADVPTGLDLVLQIARNNNWAPDNKCCTVEDIVETTENCGCVVADCGCSKLGAAVADCNGQLIGNFEVAFYRPYFDLQWEYNLWTSSAIFQRDFTPVRLANNSFFNTLVCKEKDQSPYLACEDEYTIIGTMDRKFKFSFEKGHVAVSFNRAAIDLETGYPLVPDEIRFITAITYYLKWKIAEWYTWNGREGFAKKADDAERLWNKYAKQAKSNAKMPKTIDEYQNLLEASHRLIPNHKRYYGFFGNLGRYENRRFNDPDDRNHYYNYNRS